MWMHILNAENLSNSHIDYFVKYTLRAYALKYLHLNLDVYPLCVQLFNMPQFCYITKKITDSSFCTQGDILTTCWNLKM